MKRVIIKRTVIGLSLLVIITLSLLLMINNIISYNTALKYKLISMCSTYAKNDIPLLDKYMQIRANTLFDEASASNIKAKVIKTADEKIKTGLQDKSIKLIYAVTIMGYAEKEKFNAIAKDAISEPQAGAIADLPKSQVTCTYDLLGNQGDYTINMTMYNTYNFSNDQFTLTPKDHLKEYRVTLLDKINMLTSLHFSNN